MRPGYSTHACCSAACLCRPQLHGMRLQCLCSPSDTAARLHAAKAMCDPIAQYQPAHTTLAAGLAPGTVLHTATHCHTQCRTLPHSAQRSRHSCAPHQARPRSPPHSTWHAPAHHLTPHGTLQSKPNSRPATPGKRPGALNPISSSAAGSGCSSPASILAAGTPTGAVRARELHGRLHDERLALTHPQLPDSPGELRCGRACDSRACDAGLRQAWHGTDVPCLAVLQCCPRWAAVCVAHRMLSSTRSST
jgi:hypothetical protein